MSRNVPHEELDIIERVVSEYPEGIGISALERALAPLLIVNRRTLQRRLKRLVEDGKIISEGESIALVYKHAPSSVGSSRLTVHVKHSHGIEMESYVPVSPQGGIIRDFVRQPLMRRKPIGYQRSFLEDCEPVATFYLSESLRAQFHEMGRTPAGECLAGTYAREILNRLLVEMVSGLFFGLAFGMAGIGAAVLGKLADIQSIDYVYRLCSFLPLLGLLAAFLPDIGRSPNNV